MAHLSGIPDSDPAQPHIQIVGVPFMGPSGEWVERARDLIIDDWDSAGPPRRPAILAGSGARCPAYRGA